MKLGELRKLTSNLSDDYEITIQTYDGCIYIVDTIDVNKDNKEIILYEI